MATTIIIDYNALFPRSMLPAKCSAASVCYYASNNITVKHYLATVRLLQPKTKQSYICQHGEYGLPALQVPPTSFSSARLTWPIGYLISHRSLCLHLTCYRVSSSNCTKWKTMLSFNYHLYYGTWWPSS